MAYLLNHRVIYAKTSVDDTNLNLTEQALELDKTADLITQSGLLVHVQILVWNQCPECAEEFLTMNDAKWCPFCGTEQSSWEEALG